MQQVLVKMETVCFNHEQDKFKLQEELNKVQKIRKKTKKEKSKMFIKQSVQILINFLDYRRKEQIFQPMFRPAMRFEFTAKRAFTN